MKKEWSKHDDYPESGASPVSEILACGIYKYRHESYTFISKKICLNHIKNKDLYCVDKNAATNQFPRTSTSSTNKSNDDNRQQMNFIGRTQIRAEKEIHRRHSQQERQEQKKHLNHYQRNRRYQQQHQQ